MQGLQKWDRESDRRPGKARVLLAEDDDGVRAALERFLLFDGYRVRAVRGEDALVAELATQMVRERRVDTADILITNTSATGYDGVAVVEALRESGWTNPVIVMSSYDDRTLKRRIEQLEGVILLPKPFEVSDLEHALATLTS